MKWQGRQGSSNIEDRRGQRSGGGGLGGGFGRGGGLGNSPLGQGGGFRLPTGRSGGGMSGIIIVIVFIGIALVMGINPLSILTGGDSSTNVPFQQTLPPQNANQDELTQFVGVMVKDTEDYWGQYFRAQGSNYVAPKVVLFSGQTQSGCGVADQSSGPFYCPTDQKVYVDLSFYEQLRRQFGAPGDFAQAYVIAHEVGHHVQQLIGVLPDFNRARQTMSQEQANHASVQVELQADCFAGTWAKAEFEAGFLEAGDVEEAINAANQIGDDRLTGGRVPSSQFTHGTSEQRMEWFRRGYESGDPTQCDTSSV
ncbi:MAG: flagellar biosynthesis protein FlgM [Hyphomicrobiales bacterium]|nr:MAG: flagellar biosynthesis protein FlgM [Hyphomicrobiales bacterium]